MGGQFVSEIPSSESPNHGNSDSHDKRRNRHDAFTSGKRAAGRHAVGLLNSLVPFKCWMSQFAKASTVGVVQIVIKGDPFLAAAGPS